MSLPPPRRPLKTRSIRRRRTVQSPPAPVLRQDDAPSVGKLVSKLLKFLLVVAVLSGIVWVYMRSLKDVATTSQNVNYGLRAVAAELWDTGLALEIPDLDPDLTRTLTQLKLTLGGTPPNIVVTDDTEGGSGSASGTHQIIYTAGQRLVLTLDVFYDPMEHKLEVRGYELGPEYRDILKDFKPLRPAPPGGDPAAGKPEQRGL